MFGPVDQALAATIHQATARRSPPVSQRWVRRCELGPLQVDVHYRPICNGLDAEIEGVVIGDNEPIDPSEFAPATLKLWRVQIENDLARLHDELRAAA